MRNRMLKLSPTIFVVPLILFSSVALADCTKDQAFNKMMKVNQINVAIQAEMPKDPSADVDAANAAVERIQDFATMMAPAGPLLAAGKYNEACIIYDQITAKYGAGVNAPPPTTMEQIKKNGAQKKKGGCDIIEMAKQNAQLAVDFQAAYDEGKFTTERQRQFSKDSEKLNMLATSDPSAACDEIALLRRKYGL
jgi:hypothetical protein